MTYTQRPEEETAILAWAGERRGSFLDLGCYDGESYSTTAALADRGWGGLCIDAAPDMAAACARRYVGRDDVDVLVAAFDAEAEDPRGAPAMIFWTPAAMYSSLEPNRRADSPATPILIPVVDHEWLAAWLAAASRPLFVNIDLEGGETIAALRWLLIRGSADCVCVEANNPGERAEVADLLEGWSPLEVNPSNSIYARAPVEALL